MVDTADVVVVGGGIAGASIAYELAASRSVVLLEADRALARHATARSAATYIPGHGNAEVRALIAASGPRFAALVEELGTPPLLSPRAVLHVALDDEGERVLAGDLSEQAGEPGAPEPIDPARAERRCPALAPGRVRAAAVVEGAADIDAEALHQGYVRGLRARGGSVRAGSPVTGLRRHGDGWRIEAGAGRIDCAEVVDAAGAWADVVAGLAGVPRIGLTPLRRTIAVVRVPDPARLRGPDPVLPMVCEAAERWYFKAEGPALLCSPGDETPVEPHDVRPDELDVAAALERVEDATGLGLRSVQTSWAGLRSFVPDRRPVVGGWPDHPGFWFFAGQGGFGIESSPALAAVGAAVVTGAPVPADVRVAVGALAPSRAGATTADQL
ncbi:MAG TPA: FAD-binding oxidoreductase [Pseudonocardia sp.]|nr:FAD-binding oxidoreductase [Pseudonocardia sp.]